MCFFLMPLVGLGSFFLGWMRGFSSIDIFNRRLDWMITNIMTTSFLTGFKPCFVFLKNLILFLIDFFVGFFKPQKRIKQLSFIQEKNAREQAKLEEENKKLAAKVSQLENKISMKKDTKDGSKL